MIREPVHTLTLGDGGIEVTTASGQTVLAGAWRDDIPAEAFHVRFLD